jgi:predicted esterase
MTAHGANKGWARSRFVSVAFAALVMSALIGAVATGCADSGADLGTNASAKNAKGSKNGNSGTGADGTGADGTGAPGSITPGQTTSPDGGPPPLVCNPIVSGTSSLKVNGATRLFDVQMPSDTSKMAILFLWHGWMQLPSDFSGKIVYDVPSRTWKAFDPNAFNMPLMIVTPWDTKMIPPWGLDWDIATGAVDFPFFEGMMTCIKQQFTIDESRIYSFGFSAGAVFTNLLSAKYPHTFAATISESGAWFNDKEEWSDVAVPIVSWKWPDFVPTDEVDVLLTHGGEKDYATVISLESANNKAVPFLYKNGRTVTECSHNFGHTLDPDLTQGMIYDYMWRHQLGQPGLTDLPPGFPTQAAPVGATSCKFHMGPR